jgi:hypothetical protein
MKVYKALKTFHGEEFRSEYVKGMTYKARQPETEEVFERWVKEGKFAFVGEVGANADVNGKG